MDFIGSPVEVVPLKPAIETANDAHDVLFCTIMELSASVVRARSSHVGAHFWGVQLPLVHPVTWPLCWTPASVTVHRVCIPRLLTS